MTRERLDRRLPGGDVPERRRRGRSPASGHFTPAQRHANTIPLAAGSTAGVKFVRYTMIGTQVADLGGTCPGPFSGCDFMDSTELEVFGAPTP